MKCEMCGKEFKPTRSERKRTNCCFDCSRIIGSRRAAETMKKSYLDKFLKEGLDLGCMSKPGQRVRDYLLESQGNKCAICGIPPVWNEKLLTFICDHIDGDSSHNVRENLRMICHNCDSQLPTYKSRNKNSSRRSRKKYYTRKSKPKLESAPS